jgi:hypothetical protein
MAAGRARKRLKGRGSGLEFDWSEQDASHRDEVRQFLAEVLPADWDEISKHGPGSDSQSAFSKTFCAAMAAKGWLTQH